MKLSLVSFSPFSWSSCFKLFCKDFYLIQEDPFHFDCMDCLLVKMPAKPKSPYPKEVPYVFRTPDSFSRGCSHSWVNKWFPGKERCHSEHEVAFQNTEPVPMKKCDSIAMASLSVKTRAVEVTQRKWENKKGLFLSSLTLPSCQCNIMKMREENLKYKRRGEK